jgi:hypothetical protein
MTPEQRQALLDLYAAAFDWQGRVAEDVFDQAEELRKTLGCPVPPEVADISALPTGIPQWGYPSLLCESQEALGERLTKVFGDDGRAAKEFFGKLQDRGLLALGYPLLTVAQRAFLQRGVKGTEEAREVLRGFLVERGKPGL